MVFPDSRVFGREPFLVRSGNHAQAVADRALNVVATLAVVLREVRVFSELLRRDSVRERWVVVNSASVAAVADLHFAGQFNLIARLEVFDDEFHQPNPCQFDAGCFCVMAGVKAATVLLSTRTGGLSRS